MVTPSEGRTLVMKVRWHEKEHAWFRYWQSLSFSALLRVSVAVFVTFSTFSFVSDLAVPQFPLGLFPQVTFESAPLEVSSGDLLAVVSDGFTEVTNHEQEEFGLGRLEQLLAQNASRPLGEIWEAVRRETTRYGEQQDDQTLLLVRITA